MPQATFKTTLLPDAEGDERDCLVEVDWELGYAGFTITEICFEDAERDQDGHYTKRNSCFDHKHPDFAGWRALVDNDHIERKIVSWEWEYA